jgi:predicted nucleic acid-binding Zn ribbon protein
MNLRVCLCGKPSSKRFNWYYCSEECKLGRKKFRAKKECLFCGKPFETFRRNSQKYCSEKCRDAFYIQRHRFAYGPNVALMYAGKGIRFRNIAAHAK